MRKQKPAKFWSWTNKPLARQIFSTCRMLHIYVSTTLFSLLIFFCVTGITLNHIDWLSDNTQQTTTFTLAIVEEPLDELNKLNTSPLTELLANELGLSKVKEVNIDFELGEVTADYSLPAGYAFATWYIYAGLVEVDYQTGSIIAIMNDLHKGRHAGTAWRWLIDIAAIFMLLFSLTGLVILFQQLKRRGTGLWLLLWGTVTPILVYLIWVPQIHI